MSGESGKSSKFKWITGVIVPIFVALAGVFAVVLEKCDEWDWCRGFVTNEIATETPSPLPKETEMIAEEPPSIAVPGVGFRKKIVFVSNRDGDNELYMMTVSQDESGGLVSSNLVQLTNNAESDTYPAWSPDGSQIAFQSNQGGDYDIYVMDGGGRQITALTHNSAFDSSPAWSPDGSQIAFHSLMDGDRDIYVMDVPGGNPINLTNNTGIEDYSPTWSPNGDRIAFYSDRHGVNDIYVINATGGNAKRLTFNGGEDPAWSPDGKLIAYASCLDKGSDDGKKCDLYTVSADFTGEVNCLLCDPNVSDMRPKWGPNGKLIAFDSNRGGDWDVWVMDVDSGELFMLTDNDDWDGIPAWQP